MRIDKTIKGELFPYHVKLISNTMTAEVRWMMSDEPVIGTITDDFKYVVLPQTFLSPYISGVGYVPVGKLKLSKHQQSNAKDYNEKYEVKQKDEPSV